MRRFNSLLEVVSGEEPVSNIRSNIQVFDIGIFVLDRICPMYEVKRYEKHKQLVIVEKANNPLMM